MAAREHRAVKAQPKEFYHGFHGWHGWSNVAALVPDCLSKNE